MRISFTLGVNENGKSRGYGVGVRIRQVTPESLAMLDPETCLIALYVAVDTLCKEQVPEPAPKRGRKPSLSVSEVVTLAIFGQWAEFRSERGFLRWAGHRGPFTFVWSYRSGFGIQAPLELASPKSQ